MGVSADAGGKERTARTAALLSPRHSALNPFSPPHPGLHSGGEGERHRKGRGTSRDGLIPQAQDVQERNKDIKNFVLFVTFVVQKKERTNRPDRALTQSSALGTQS